MEDTQQINSLGKFLSENDSVVVLSGAGVSTASGIPDYRDRNGEWKQAQPMQIGELNACASARKRYWARSYIGWFHFSRARPNSAHRALADLESLGKVEMLVTQYADGLHTSAGSQRVIDLHGRLSKIRCIDCDTAHEREQYQETLRRANPHWHAEAFSYQPDGDAVLAKDTYEDFSVPGCPACGGIVKPDVVMFGESVPKARVKRAMSAIDSAAALQQLSAQGHACV